MKKQYQTPELPYKYDALEPYIDKETMAIHHDKHHEAYTKKLNSTLENNPKMFDKTPVELLMDLSAIPESIRTAVRNNGGGHVNHNLFWEVMGSEAGGQPQSDLLAAIKKNFGSFEEFQEEFEQAATTQFGSGWAWLTLSGGKLMVEKTANQDTPLSEGRTPLLALDVWEHAYYLKYQNKRPDYIKAFWQVVNWDAVNEKYQQAK
ncbi:superoxide dismutase [Patescibacteria group bacterium]|nr:superoxide dismutase [Patescibacteria group bacterium]